MEDRDFYVFKTIQSNRKGIPDIIACAPNGRFIGIEVKHGYNKPSKLQAWNLMRICKNRGIGIVAWSLEDVIDELILEEVIDESHSPL